MSETIRAFIAIELPESIRKHIRSLQEGLRSYGFKVKWVEPKNIHLTLKFLGDIHSSDIETISKAMTEAVVNREPIQLGAKGIGVFPGIKKPRVIWIGLKGDTFSLIELQKTLEDQLEMEDFPKEDRAFKAHLTLARVKDFIDSKNLLEAMKKFADIESEMFYADELILFKSDLKPSGPVYTKLVTLSLKC